MSHYLSHSAEETMAIGYEFGKTLKPNDVVCFMGELAAGKTTFIKGLAAGAADYPPERVNSPTFVYLNIYQGQKAIYHFDLYRLHEMSEFLSMGFDDMLFAGGICCIEWSERITQLLPPQAIFVSMKHGENETRLITIKSYD